jgi:hypothetical protein
MPSKDINASDCKVTTLILIYNFTEITITTPSLTRIVDRLIGGGISLYSDIV